MGYAVQVTNNISYGPKSLNKLNVYLPQGTSGVRRAVLVIHGGYFTQGSKDDPRFVALSKSLASAGFVAVNINYRLLNSTVKWPAPLSDSQLAVRFTRSKAASWNIDPNTVIAYGWSAGAHLASLMSSKAVAEGDQASRLPSYASRVQRAVMVSGLYNNPGDSIDPFLFIDANTSPTYIVTGNNDRYCPVSRSQDYYDRLVALGVSAVMEVYAGGHVWQGASASERAAIEARVRAWLAL